MATLDSPLEALALEYASFGCLAVVNNVWTWIAVVTAAVSFWRIRVTTIKVEDGLGCGLLEGSKASKAEQETGHHEPQAMAGPVEKTATAPAMETVDWEPLVCGDGVTRGKLTMYYEVDDVDGDRCVDRDGELTAVHYAGGLGSCGEWWERWERVLKMRTGDDDWYRYVDLTVLNGSVVRLWDDKRNP
ncbi:Transmembrane protein [Hirschfeldia incana]|nr:Transmembrane protein [Hirschfeldia incana]